MTLAARLPADLVAVPATLVTAGAVLVLVAGVAASALARRGAAGATFAAHARLALDLLLAAGLIRLAAAETYGALASVAAIVAIRQVVGRGVRFGSRAAGA